MEFTLPLRFDVHSQRTRRGSEYEAPTCGTTIAAPNGCTKDTLPMNKRIPDVYACTAQRSDFEMVSSYRRSYPTTMFGRMKGMGRVEGWHRCVGNPIHRHTMCSTRDALAGSCSMHSGPRSVVAKALRSGYNWPNMHRDARDMIQNCKDSQGTPPLFIDSMSRDESSHIPSEIGMPTIRTAEVNITTNDDERRIDLDILEERREQAAIREEKAKLKMV
ncbi:hypothetical protein Tco_1135778 [Tanacetum coccineum]